MRLDELVSRLIVLESKVNYLSTGVYNVLPVANDLTELDARLTMLETTVDMLVAQKTNEIMSTVATTEGTTPDVDTIVSLSPSATFPEASDIVSAVVQSQVELPAIESETGAAAIATAITSVVTAQPEVVTDADMMIETILNAIADQPSVPAEEADQTVEALGKIISNVTGQDVTEEIKAQIIEAITSEPNPILDSIEARLDAVESKYNTLVSK
jgi:hypothetical protein